ncbi:MAG TPA: GntP family permease [Selenomonadales bacterium]|nr:GntP family permease [Selenomonadales bacterium]
MEVLGILLSLILLITFAYRGFSVILFAPIFALIAASMSNLPLMPSYTELFMAKGVTYVKSFFPIFMLGAVFGKVMEQTGMAQSIAHEVIQRLGKKRVVLAVCVAGMILSYGGISMFVCVFAIYPFASAMFKEAQIPKRLLPSCIVLGVFCSTMDAFPGSPQIQNIIPSTYLGTSLYSAPILGTIGGIFLIVVGYLFIEWRVHVAMAASEGYGNHTRNESIIDENAVIPPWQLSVLPLLTVLVVNALMTFVYQWDPALLNAFHEMKLPLVAASVKNAITIWALIIGLVTAIVLAAITGYKYIPKTSSLKEALNLGALGSLLAIMNTASEVGYGNVIASLPGFKIIAQSLLGVGMSAPLFNEAVMVNILAGITGSASGGMAIALDIFGKHWLELTAAQGIPPEVVHRVASMASGGLDTLPHNGAIITLLAVCGLTHRESYNDIFGLTCLKIVTAFLVVGLYMLTGIV